MRGFSSRAILAHLDTLIGPLALVAAIVGELGLDALEQGASCDDVYFALWHKSVDPRHSDRYVDGALLHNTDGVLLFADDRVVSGDRVLMLLQARHFL